MDVYQWHSLLPEGCHSLPLDWQTLDQVLYPLHLQWQKTGPGSLRVTDFLSGIWMQSYKMLTNKLTLFCFVFCQSVPYLHLAKRGFRQVKPSLWTTFIPSLRNVAWLLSAIFFWFRHWSTGGAANEGGQVKTSKHLSICMFWLFRDQRKTYTHHTAGSHHVSHAWRAGPGEKSSLD